MLTERFFKIIRNYKKKEIQWSNFEKLLLLFYTLKELKEKVNPAYSRSKGRVFRIYGVNPFLLLKNFLPGLIDFYPARFLF